MKNLGKIFMCGLIIGLVLIILLILFPLFFRNGSRFWDPTVRAVPIMNLCRLAFLTGI